MTRAVALWGALLLALGVPIALAMVSPQLAWRDPVYIASGFAGIVAMALLLVQPLLAAGLLPGLSMYNGRRAHRWIGGALVLAVVLHVAGLWITSPPDVIDALLFASPTPFAVWGVVAMWAVLATALWAGLRRKLRPHWHLWRTVHAALAVVIIVGTVVHAVLIEGTMETLSKVAFCAVLVGVTAKVFIDLRIWAGRSTPRQAPHHNSGSP